MTVRPADWLAAAIIRTCSRRVFVAQAADSGHTVSCPESASYDTAATCPANSGAMAAHHSRSVAPGAGSSHACSVTSAPIAAPGPSGRVRRAGQAVRGLGCCARPPFLRAASVAARRATRARSTPVPGRTRRPTPTALALVTGVVLMTVLSWPS